MADLFQDDVYKEYKYNRKRNVIFVAVIIFSTAFLYAVISEMLSYFLFTDNYYDYDKLQEKLKNTAVKKGGDVWLLTNYIIEDKENNIELEFNYTEFTDLFNYTVEINEKNNDKTFIRKEVRQGNDLYVYNEKDELITKKRFYDRFLFFPYSSSVNEKSYLSDSESNYYSLFYEHNKSDISDSVNGFVTRKIHRKKGNPRYPMVDSDFILYDYPLIDEGIYNPVIYIYTLVDRDMFSDDVIFGPTYYTIVRSIKKNKKKLVMKLETRIEKTDRDGSPTYRGYGKSKYIYKKKSAIFKK